MMRDVDTIPAAASFGLPYHPTALDRQLAGVRSVFSFGAVPGLNIAAVRDRMRALANAPRSHVVMVAARNARRWHRDPTLAERNVIEIDPQRWNTIDEFNHLAAAADISGAGTGVVVSGDHVSIIADHGVGDAGLMLTLAAALCAPQGAERLAAMLEVELPARRLHRAAFELLTQKAARAVLTARRAYNVAPAARPKRTIPASWRASRVVVNVQLSADASAALHASAERRWPDASGLAVSIAMLTTAFRDAGLPMNDNVVIPVDCRRYLDKEYWASVGNGAVAVRVGGIDLGSPTDISVALQRITSSRWPLAVYSTAALKGAAGRIGPTPEGESVVDDVVSLAVSDVGDSPLLRAIPLGPQAQVCGTTAPAGPTAITVVRLRGVWGTMLSATFYADVIDTATVRAAMTRIASDPMGLLA
jgi:hypothetical protein